MFETNEPKATTDELFRVVLIDRKRQKKLTINLVDPRGDIVPIKETIEKLTEYISDKAVAEEKNNYNQQIMPLMAQSMVGGLVKLLGEYQTAMTLSHPILRSSLIYMMTVGFSLLKWIQKKDIKIVTMEEDITAEDIEMYDRVSIATDLSLQGSAVGINPTNILNELVDQGKLKKSDLEKMGYDVDELLGKKKEEPKSTN